MARSSGDRQVRENLKSQAPASVVLRTNAEPHVLFGAEISFTADVLDTLERLQIPVAAGILTVPPQWSLRGIPAIFNLEETPEHFGQLACVLCAAGPKSRRALHKQAADLGFSRFPAIVDPTAIIPASVYLERGTFINAGAVFGSAVELDEFAMVNRAAAIGHHAVLEPYAVVGPGAVLASGVRAGAGAMIGAGAVVLPSVNIGQDALVGAGAVVPRDVGAGQTVMGNPARPTSKNAETGDTSM